MNSRPENGPAQPIGQVVPPPGPTGRVVPPHFCGGGAATPLPPGWRRDEAGRLVRETIHRMTRRCRNWDYRCDAAYMITLELADRRRPLLGRLVVPAQPAQEWAGTTTPPCGGGAMVATEGATIALSPLGRAIEAQILRIPEFAPEIEILAEQIMPEHLHIVLRVQRNMARPLGAVIRGFKAGCYKLLAQKWASTTTLFAPGFVDTILFDSQAVERAVAYVRDNPRRLAVKRANPDLFKVRQELWVEYRPNIPAQEWAGTTTNQIVVPPRFRGGWFSAIGNLFLLKRPMLAQVQCSRSIFAYRRRKTASGWEIERDAAGRGLVERTTPEFEEKLAEALAAAAHGAVLVSPCISHGEREIAARAFAAGHSVVALQNKGFSPLYKPGGKRFERCAAGNLLLLAPLAWPYVPGEKPPTRESSLVLNRIAQLLCGSGAAQIAYRGATMRDIDRLVSAATQKEGTP